MTEQLQQKPDPQRDTGSEQELVPELASISPENDRSTNGSLYYKLAEILSTSHFDYSSGKCVSFITENQMKELSGSSKDSDLWLFFSALKRSISKKELVIPNFLKGLISFTHLDDNLYKITADPSVMIALKSLLPVLREDAYSFLLPESSTLYVTDDLRILQGLAGATVHGHEKYLVSADADVPGRMKFERQVVSDRDKESMDMYEALSLAVEAVQRELKRFTDERGAGDDDFIRYVASQQFFGIQNVNSIGTLPAQLKEMLLNLEYKFKTRLDVVSPAKKEDVDYILLAALPTIIMAKLCLEYFAESPLVGWATIGSALISFELVVNRLLESQSTGKLYREAYADFLSNVSRIRLPAMAEEQMETNRERESKTAENIDTTKNSRLFAWVATMAASSGFDHKSGQYICYLPPDEVTKLQEFLTSEKTRTLIEGLIRRKRGDCELFETIEEHIRIEYSRKTGGLILKFSSPAKHAFIALQQLFESDSVKSDKSVRLNTFSAAIPTLAGYSISGNMHYQWQNPGDDSDDMDPLLTCISDDVLPRDQVDIFYFLRNTIYTTHANMSRNGVKKIRLLR